MIKSDLIMIKDVLFYFVLPIVALMICSLLGTIGLIIAIVLTMCVQFYTFRQSLSNKKQIKDLEQRQNGLDDAFNVERNEDGTVAGWAINPGDY